MGNQLGMVTGTGVECNSQKSVDFEGETGVLSYKTKAPNFGISATVGPRDMCILVCVHMYTFMLLLACINGIMNFLMILHLGI